MAEIVLLHSADVNIQRAYEWFESWNEGAGDILLEDLDRLLGLLANFPEMGPIVYGRRRRFIMREYNYGVFYTLTGPRVLVSNVLDLRQDPAAIRKELDE